MNIISYPLIKRLRRFAANGLAKLNVLPYLVEISPVNIQTFSDLRWSWVVWVDASQLLPQECLFPAP